MSEKNGKEAGYAKAKVFGRVSREPKCGRTKNGQPYAMMSVAIPSYRSGETFISLSSFGKAAQQISCLGENDIVEVIGNLSNRKVGETDGKAIWGLQISATSVNVIHSESESKRKKEIAEDTDDIPF